MAKGTIVVSLRSKGLPSFTRSVVFDFRYQAVQFATEFLDVFFAFIVSVACLSWTAWMSIGIMIAALAGTRSSNYESATDAVIIFFMYIVLPLTLLLFFVFSRRDTALRSLSEFKAAFVSLLLGRPVGTTAAQREASDELYRKAATFIEDVRQYLQHRRPYARHFFLPYRSSAPSPNDELLKVSRELGLYLRRVHRGIRDMHMAVARLRETGASEQLAMALENKVTAVHAAVEQLSSIKEMRTPVVLRATFRWLVVVVIPVSMGPAWSHVVMPRNPTFGGIVGVLSHIALMGILDTVAAMEDPFDDTALDGISLFEVLDQVGVMTAPTSDGDGYDTEGLGVGRNTSGGGCDVGDGTSGGATQHPTAHVAMYVNSGGEGGIGTGGDAPGSGGGNSTPSVTDSAGGASSVGPLESPSPVQRLGIPPGAGVPAMHSSVVTSETAVGPPSAMDPYGGGVPSITSPPLQDVGAVIRVPNIPPMPPMPALAGSPVYRTGPAVH
ncbi:hypothetical protein Vretimale_11874 [Volvox reticuliferus]|uniref:Uncharacterized protein n=1 Tax=Volvox reticuliferus TaxID=1737510 RepID=A0A8J4GJ14_9CHLO|nr:hypothetical protein Vretifemale_11414 [Volvox reticuliferus]GIM07799.1 hypothetical protein Vretimale_11874 [Volvox reticuliferus]